MSFDAHNLPSDKQAAELAFEQGKAAIVPDADTSAISALTRVAYVEPAKPHPWDRFARFDSLHGLLDAAAKPPSNPNAAKRHRAFMSGPHFSSPSWEGMERLMAFSSVASFLEGGWPQGAEQMAKAIENVEPPPARDMRRRGKWAEDGAELSGERLYSGAFDSAWRTTNRRIVLAPLRVRIVVDLGAACGMCAYVGCMVEPLDARALFWRGAAAAGLSESLERAGYSVDVVAAVGMAWTDLAHQPYSESSRRQYHRGPDEGCGAHIDMMFSSRADNAGYRPRSMPEYNLVGVRIGVKDAGSWISPAGLASATASAATYRRGVLTWVTSTTMPGAWPNDVSGGRAGVSGHYYGAHVQVASSERLRGELGLDEEGVTTVYVSDWVLSKQLANAWVKGTLYGLEHHRTEIGLYDQEDEGAL